MGVSGGPMYTAPLKSHDYCLGLVRKVDYDHYLLNLMQPRGARRAHAALRALNIELARVSEVVSKPQLGELRLEWFRDVISSMYRDATPPSHPVLQALKEAIDHCKISRTWLLRLIDGRAEDVQQRAPASLSAMEEHADRVHGSLYTAHLEVLGVRSPAADHAAANLGKADGLTRSIVAAPVAAARGITFMPAEMRKKLRVSDKQMLSAPTAPDSPASDVYYDVASAAWGHLEMLRADHSRIPPAAVPALLTSHAVEWKLETLRRLHFDPFQSQLHHPGTRVLIGFRLLKGRIIRRL